MKLPCAGLLSGEHAKVRREQEMLLVSVPLYKVAVIEMQYSQASVFCAF
jgi:hypothetical protein